MSLFLFSLSCGYFENYDTPQLEYISNAFEILWDKPKAEVLTIMSIFPHYECTDYGDQLSCVSIYNREGAAIYLNFFMDDYEARHDNLWKVSVTVDIGEPMLSMHSIREMMATSDHEDMIKLVKALYR